MYLKKGLQMKALSAALMIMLLIPTAALGAETDEANGTANNMELTLDRATDMALANSSELKLADYSIEKNQDSRDDAMDSVKFTPTGGDATDEAVSDFIGLVNSDITLQMSKKSKDIKSDSVVKTVYQYYTNVLAAQERVAVAEKTLAYSDYQRLVARVSYQVGKVSLSDKDAAESDYIDKQAALTESRVNLEDCYIKLNNLIGLNQQDRPVLKDDPGYALLKIDNLDTEVNRRLENNPSLWQSQQNIDKAKLNLNLYNGSSSSSYNSLEIAVSEAEINAADDKKTMRQSIIDTYNTILQQEEQYKSKQQSLKQAEDDLVVARLKYELGMIPKGDILSAELSAANARLSLKTATYQHELSKLSFDKPWA